MKKSLNILALLYAATIYIAQVLTIIFNIWLMRILPVSEFGLYSYAKTLSQYLDYAGLGSRYAMDRLIPVSSDRKSKLILHVALFNMLLFSVFLVFVFCLSHLISGFVEIIIVSAGLFYSLTNLYVVYRRDRSDFQFMIIFNFLLSIIPIFMASVAFLVHVNHLWFIVLLLFAGQFGIFVFILLNNNLWQLFIKVPRFYLKKSLYLLRVGFPMFLSSFIIMFGMTADRLFIRFFYGYKELGIYAVILYVFSFMIILPNLIGQVFAPKIVQFIRVKDVSYVYKSLLFVLGLMLPMVLVVFVVTPMLVPRFLPKYILYTQEMSYASAIVIPYGLMFPFIAALNALDQRNKMVRINCVALLIYLVLLLIYLWLSKHLNYDFLLLIKCSYGVLTVVFLYVAFKQEFSKFIKSSENI